MYWGTVGREQTQVALWSPWRFGELQRAILARFIGVNAGEWGRLRVISLKIRAGRLLFMALTLIVLSGTGADTPQRWLRVPHHLSCTCGELGLAQPGLNSCFRILCERKTRILGRLEEASPLSQPGVSEGCSGMRWSPGRSCPCSELALGTLTPPTAPFSRAPGPQFN